MGLDIDLFRVDKGGNPDLVRESQRRRHKDVTLVDQVVETDTEWRRITGYIDSLRKAANLVAKTVGAKKKAKEEDGTSDPVPQEIIEQVDTVTQEVLARLSVNQLKTLSPVLKEMEKQSVVRQEELEAQRDRALGMIGNIVHESVPVSSDEEDNRTLRTWGEIEKPQAPFNHIELLTALDGMDLDRGRKVAGGRAYFLKNGAVRLQLALINYAVNFLVTRGYTPMYTPFFMLKSAMAQVAQLEQFDEELYKVTGEGDDKYLIATSEQTICGYFAKEWMDPKELPLRIAGMSTCFRKEVGSHGRDTLGIFRVHQFEKIEQFVVCSPTESWEIMDTMIANSEAFYQSLGLPYRVVSIVSGALNNAAAMKYDLEALFPASQKFRELVSCSNCTDYQARHVECRFGLSKKTATGPKEYVHMLNSTLCALTRTICCICENFQEETGVRVPEVLVPYMNGQTFLEFKTKPVKIEEPAVAPGEGPSAPQ